MYEESYYGEMSEDNFFDKQGRDVLENFDGALEALKEATLEVAKYAYSKLDRDKYRLLNDIAHCGDYYYLAEPLFLCFRGLSEREQEKYFRF